MADKAFQGALAEAFDPAVSAADLSIRDAVKLDGHFPREAFGIIPNLFLTERECFFPGLIRHGEGRITEYYFAQQLPNVQVFRDALTPLAREQNHPDIGSAVSPTLLSRVIAVARDCDTAHRILTSPELLSFVVSRYTGALESAAASDADHLSGTTAAAINESAALLRFIMRSAYQDYDGTFIRPEAAQLDALIVPAVNILPDRDSVHRHIEAVELSHRELEAERERGHVTRAEPVEGFTALQESLTHLERSVLPGYAASRGALRGLPNAVLETVDRIHGWPADTSRLLEIQRAQLQPKDIQPSKLHSVGELEMYFQFEADPLLKAAVDLDIISIQSTLASNPEVAELLLMQHRICRDIVNACYGRSDSQAKRWWKDYLGWSKERDGRIARIKELEAANPPEGSDAERDILLEKLRIKLRDDLFFSDARRIIDSAPWGEQTEQLRVEYEKRRRALVDREIVVETRASLRRGGSSVLLDRATFNVTLEDLDEWRFTLLLAAFDGKVPPPPEDTGLRFEWKETWWGGMDLKSYRYREPTKRFSIHIGHREEYRQDGKLVSSVDWFDVASSVRPVTSHYVLMPNEIGIITDSSDIERLQRAVNERLGLYPDAPPLLGHAELREKHLVASLGWLFPRGANIAELIAQRARDRYEARPELPGDFYVQVKDQMARYFDAKFRSETENADRPQSQ